MSAEPHVGFRIGDVSLAVAAARVLSIAPASAVVPVPFARRWFAGVILRQGRMVPIVDLAAVDGLWNIVPPGGGTQIVVLQAGEIEAGFLVSSVETVTPVEGRKVMDGSQPAPCALRGAILSGALKVSGREWGLLKVNTALAAAGIPAPPENQGGARVDG